MAELNKELWEKTKQANSPEELLALAKENNVELTREQAEAFFEKMNKSGELSDDELANAAGGGACSSDSSKEDGYYPDLTCPKCGSQGLYRHTTTYIIDYTCYKCGWIGF